MTDVLGMFDYDLLKAVHLPPGGCVATITRVEQTVLDKDPTKKPAKKPLVHLAEFGIPLLLNKTNAKTIIAMYGRDTAEWAGQRVSIYPTLTEYAGDQVDCIRVRPGIPPAPKRGRGAKETPALPAKPPVLDAELEEQEETAHA